MMARRDGAGAHGAGLVVPVAPRSVSARASAALDRRRCDAGRAFDSAAAAIAALERGGHVFGLTKGQFSMIDLVDAVLARTGPAVVTVWTWCIAAYEVEAVGAFLRDQRVRSLRMVLDWSGAQREPALMAELQTRFGLDCVRVTKTHAKIATIGTPDGWRVVIRGSMNLNANPRFEQFDVSDNSAAFDVVHGIEAELWARGSPMPAAQLSHAQAADLLRVGEAPAPAWATDTGGKWW